MVDPVFTYVGGIAFLVLIIGPMLYLMYNYEGIDAAEDTPNENVVQGAGPIASEGPDTDGEAVEGGAEDTRDAVEAGEPADADEPTEDEDAADETAEEAENEDEDADDTEEADADDA